MAALGAAIRLGQPALGARGRAVPARVSLRGAPLLRRGRSLSAAFRADGASTSSPRAVLEDVTTRKETSAAESTPAPQEDIFSLRFPGKYVAEESEEGLTDYSDMPEHLKERNRILTPWPVCRLELKKSFGYTDAQLDAFEQLSDEDLQRAYEMMLICRDFENECAGAYMQGKIRGFMHLDNGQETIPALLADQLTKNDIKYSFYRDHTHAIASGVDPGAIMAELYGKDGGTCRGTGGSMHVYDKPTHFQGGWALVAEQLAYAVGAARSIMMDKKLGYPGKLAFRNKMNKSEDKDDRICVVFVGEGGAQNGRMAECLNAAAKEDLPLLFVVIDNGRAINTFTQDVAANQAVYRMGEHYGVPGTLVDGQNLTDVLKVGRAVMHHVRTKGPAILQVHTFRFNGHSPADPEHERNRKPEKRWARAEADPIKIFEASAEFTRGVGEEAAAACKERAAAVVQAALDFADASPDPPPSLAAELEYPDPVTTDYAAREPVGGLAEAAELTERVVPAAALATVRERIATLQQQAVESGLSIGDAVNLAILEEMLRDPTTTIHAEDLQAGSSYNIPAGTQQAFSTVRACDEIIDEGHFIGKALGEAMNNYRPIVELMNANFGIYGIAELSSAGNTYATTGGQFKMPMTVIGAGGTAPNQSLGAEHSQPFHAYIMGIPGLKICTAARPEAAYGLAKSMIRDNGPGVLLLPVKMMKIKGAPMSTDFFLPLHKATYLAKASDERVEANKAVTVLTYLHGVKEAQDAVAQVGSGYGVDLIELTSLKPLDMDTIRESLARTHRLIILDESTRSGGVGATISARVGEEAFDLLDQPVRRLCMEDAPVPYSTAIEKMVVKRCSDLVEAIKDVVR